VTQPVEYRPVVVHVLGELGTAGETARELIDYETALEGAGQAIGFYSGLIAREEAAEDPDLEAIAGWRAEQQALAARRRTLTPQDPVEIERLRDDAADLLAEDDDEDEDEDDEDLDDVDLGDDDADDDEDDADPDDDTDDDRG
jgi:hypothetical protein